MYSHHLAFNIARKLFGSQDQLWITNWISSSLTLAFDRLSYCNFNIPDWLLLFHSSKEWGAYKRIERGDCSLPFLLPLYIPSSISSCVLVSTTGSRYNKLGSPYFYGSFLPRLIVQWWVYSNPLYKRTR